jgi:hypothetical protein
MVSLLLVRSRHAYRYLNESSFDAHRDRVDAMLKQLLIGPLLPYLREPLLNDVTQST